MTLFQKAVDSIQIGVEDLSSNADKRTLSAVRNVYAGVLLLAKEALIRSAPAGQPEEIIGARYKPELDGDGGIRFVPDSQRTIDFQGLGERFRGFGLVIDQAALQDLNRIRNQVEHHYLQEGRDRAREAIAKAFPVIRSLFALCAEEPAEHLGDAWQSMLDMRELFETELAECQATLGNLEMPLGILQTASFRCDSCNSSLIRQLDEQNTMLDSAELQCRACGKVIDTEIATKTAIDKQYELETYLAATDGGDPTIGLRSQTLNT